MRFRAPEYVSWYALGAAVVLLDLRSQRRYVLNDSSAAMWRALEREPSVEDLVELLVSRFEVARQTAAQDVALWADHLQERHLLYALEPRSAACSS
jgi:hypothetical protein